MCIGGEVFGAADPSCAEGVSGGAAAGAAGAADAADAAGDLALA